MPRPVAPIVMLRLTAHFRKNGAEPEVAAQKATSALRFFQEAGLDVVIPGWVPIDQDGPSRPRKLTWDDLPQIDIEILDRQPWRPYQ